MCEVNVTDSDGIDKAFICAEFTQHTSGDGLIGFGPREWALGFKRWKGPVLFFVWLGFGAALLGTICTRFNRTCTEARAAAAGRTQSNGML